MKSVFYVGAALMLGASVYGFVDYEKNRHQREFQNLYKDKAEATDLAPVTQPVDVSTKTAILPASTGKVEELAVEKKDYPRQKKLRYKKRSLSYKEFSRSALKEEVQIAPVELKKAAEEKKMKQE